MRLAPITTIEQLRGDASALALAADHLDRALRAPAAPLASVVDAATALLARADAAATSAVTWEGDTHLGVAALQLREGVEEHFDAVDIAAQDLRDAISAGALTTGPEVAQPIYDLRRAAVILRGFGADLVDTVDARLGATFATAG